MTTDKRTSDKAVPTRNDFPGDRGLSLEDARLDALLKAARPARNESGEAALLDRIMATAERTPRLTARPAIAVIEASRTTRVETDIVRVHSAPRADAPVTGPLISLATARRVGARPRRDVLAASGMLAASLVAGLMLGQLPYAEQTVTRIEQATGLTIVASATDDFEEEDL